MAEFGILVADGPRHVGERVAILADPADRRIPTPLHEGLLAIVETLRGLEQRIERVEKQIVGWGRGNATCRHLITIPGYGPILFTAMAAMVVRPRLSPAGGTSRPRSAWYRGRTGPGERSSSVREPSAATAICAGSWSTACPRA